MVEEARTAGVRVAAHAVTERGARLAIEGGVDSIEHGYAMSDEALELAKQKGIVLVGTEHALGPDRAALSPDGKWLAYESDETGVLEIFVSPFPDAGRNRWQISTEAGRPSGRLTARSCSTFPISVSWSYLYEPTRALLLGNRKYCSSGHTSRPLVVISTSHQTAIGS